jgi:anti-sigma B factor antagonist
MLLRGDTAFLRVIGELDMGHVDECREQLAKLPQTAKELILDLRETSFIDSTGIGLLLEAWKRTERSELPFSIMVGNGQVAHAIETAGLNRFVPTLPGVPVPKDDGSLAALDS